jgi:hypothetical protein
MILAVAVPEKRELVIASADNLDVLNAFLARIQDDNPKLVQDTDFTRMLVEPELAGFKLEPTILEFAEVDEMDTFIASNKIELTTFFNAHGKQKAMLAAEEFRKDDPRTLAEIHGLVADDPWDRRTEEEKAKAEEQRQKMKDKKSKGEITEDSWGGGAGRSMSSEPTPGTEHKIDSSAIIPAGALAEGTYWQVVIAGTMGNDAAATLGIFNGNAPDAIQPVFKADVSPDVVMMVFDSEEAASVCADDMQNAFTHVAQVLVSKINETGLAEKDTEEEASGLSIRDIHVSVDPVTGEITVHRVVAEKDMFNADRYHITLFDENDEPSKNEDDYTPIIKRAGLAENTRYLGWDYDKQEDGGIAIQLGGAATLRMEGALDESGRKYTMVSMAEKKEDFVSDNPYRIALDALVETYFRVDVRGYSLSKVDQVIKDADVVKPYRTNEVGDDCWLAFLRERYASDAVNALAAANIVATVSAVDPEGALIVEEGALLEGERVVDQGDASIEPPAPWNEGAEVYAAMTDDERKATNKKLLPFILYCIHDFGAPHRLIAHLTPKTYFNKTGEMWDGDLHAVIGDLMPDSWNKYGERPGVYQCKSLDLNTADFTLGNQRGMKESLNLMSHVNSLGVERVDPA